LPGRRRGHQVPHVAGSVDELYVVLDGRGELTIEGKSMPLVEGQAAFVPADAERQFSGYEGLSVLVVFARQKEPMPLAERRRRAHPV
jgi:mannose-6-phosphate isomerase-like protein (cupin superfamily)